MNINEIKNVIKDNNIYISESNYKDLNIEYLSYDSNDIKSNTLFFAKGKHFKKEYLENNLDKGIVAYISEIDFNVDIPFIKVSDIKEAMADVSLHFYDYPYKKITTCGITGTKGKTTTLYFIKSIMDHYLSYKSAIISTVETYTKTTNEDSHLTTPEALVLNKYFNEVYENDLKYLTMEVTSQAYKEKRTKGIEFDYGIFLNIAKDHISNIEHSSFEEYFDCKLKFLEKCKTVIINKDTDKFSIVKEVVKNKNIITYSGKQDADYMYKNIVKKEIGFSFTLKNKDIEEIFTIPIEGRFNIENAVAAIIYAKLIGVSSQDINIGLAKASVKGRMNVFNKNGVTIIVDYAHNLLSFTKLYESIKLDYPNRRIISVGGAPGSKAYDRRKDFAMTVGRNSDYVYITAEDPQYETVSDICGDIITYMELDNYEVVEDRKEAVLKAFDNSKEGDVIVLLAKGEENYQKVNGEFPFYESDLKLAKDYLLR